MAEVSEAAINEEAAGRSDETDSPAYLLIEGLVAQPQRLLPEDVAELPRLSYHSRLQCDHRGDAGEQVWHGIGLRALVQLAQPQPEARYVRVHAQDYCVPLALDEIDNAVLVESLDGQPLSQSRGAPWRLFVPDSQCHVNVKWVTRLELTATRGASLVERAARARERGRLTS